MIPISKEEHIERHKVLHREFDELMADHIRHTSLLPSKTTIMELAKWSHEQTIKPTEENEQKS